jgi:PEGA domain-containing protein
MSYSRLCVLFFASVVCLAVAVADVDAQGRSRGGGGGRSGGSAGRQGGRPGGGVGHAVPRGGVRGGRTVVVSPRHVSPVFVGQRGGFYRPYGYRSGVRVGIFAGFGYPFGVGFGYPYRYGYGYPYSYGYSRYGYGYPYYSYGGYDGYGGYGYSGATYGGYAYGGVRIQGAPRDAQVFVDGYYAGIVDDFDGPFQHLNLEAGAHQIEIRAPGLPPLQYDVNVQPGQTLNIHVR